MRSILTVDSSYGHFGAVRNLIILVFNRGVPPKCPEALKHADSFQISSLKSLVNAQRGFEGLRILVTFENPKTPNPPGVSECERRRPTIGALIITYTILGVSYHSYSITGPQTLF